LSDEGQEDKVELCFPMKNLFLPSTVLLIFSFSSPARAESPIEREFKQLKQQREKALAAAAEPINRRYKDSLDQLLRRATQGNDLAAAVAVKEELAAIGSPAAANAQGSTSDKIALAGSVWQWATKETVAFNADNTAVLTRASGTVSWKWQSEADGTFTLDNGRFLLIPDKHGKTAQIKQPKDNTTFTITRLKK
jgi:hypothetical protein